MRSTKILLSLLLAFTFLSFQAFQCGSPEFTGAKVQIQQKNFAEAIRLLDLEVKKNPSNDEAWYMLGALKADQSDYAGMNVAFTEALKLSKKHEQDIKQVRYNHWGRHLNLGVSFLERASSDSLEYYDKAIGEFNVAAQAWADTGLTHRYLGYAYNNKGDMDGALVAFEKAWEIDRDAEALLRAGRIYLDRGNRLKAAFQSENAEGLKIQKSLADVRKNSKKTDVMRDLGAPDNVKKGPRGSKKEEWTYRSFNLLLTLENDKVVTKSFTSPYKPPIDSSKFRLAMAEYDKAISALETVRKNDPASSDALNVLLSAYVEADRIKEAAAVFTTAVEREPNNKLNRYILGVLLRTAGDYTGAIAQFKAAYELDPQYTEALFDLGATYYNWGVDILRLSEESAEPTEAHKEKFREALPYMEKVSEMKGDDPSVWETLGTIYAQLGMQEKAIAAFDKADSLRSGTPTQNP